MKWRTLQIKSQMAPTKKMKRNKSKTRLKRRKITFLRLSVNNKILNRRTPSLMKKMRRMKKVVLRKKMQNKTKVLLMRAEATHKMLKKMRQLMMSPKKRKWPPKLSNRR